MMLLVIAFQMHRFIAIIATHQVLIAHIVINLVNLLLKHLKRAPRDKRRSKKLIKEIINRII